MAMHKDDCVVLDRCDCGGCSSCCIGCGMALHQVTPPRPTAPTAAELLREFQDRYHSTGYVREPLLALDRLVAAVRAEALEKAALECDSFATSLDDRNDSDGEWMAEGAIECANRIRAMVSK